MMESRKYNATEGTGKLLGGLFGILYKKKWFRWFLRISLALLVLDIAKTIVVTFFK